MSLKQRHLDRLIELSYLRKGWLDGQGTSVSNAALETAVQLLESYIYPTPEGGLTLESDVCDIIIAPNGTFRIVRG